MSERAYEETAYPGDPIASAQPDRMAVVATLHGVAVTPPSRCRALEIGCGDGGNLRAAALAAPASEHVGLDRSASHIEAGQRALADEGLTNVRLVRGDLREAPDLGRFDYVIAHGLFSWVPVALQAPLLQAIAGALAPGGVAYVSYNAYPGYFMRLAVHETLRRATARATDARARRAQARALLETLVAAVPAGEAAYRAALEGEAAYLSSGAQDPAGVDAYVAHEVLSDDDHPMWFADFVALARAQGLDVLADTELHETHAPLHEAAQRAVDAEPDAVAREQLRDCFVNRHFRRTLLVRADTAREAAPSATRVRELHALSAARPEGEAGREGPLAFARRGGGKVVAATPLARAALTLLLERYPEALPFAELLAGARARADAPSRPRDEDDLARLLLDGCLADALTLRAGPPPCIGRVSERPLASPLARRAARTGAPVFNAHHERVGLPPLAHLLLPHVDGSRDAAGLVDLLAQLVGRGALTIDGLDPRDPAEARAALDGPVRASLRLFARAGLLVR
jgi:SAM-dependent methyltransferase/methyltransferase-like protein